MTLTLKSRTTSSRAPETPNLEARIAGPQAPISGANVFDDANTFDSANLCNEPSLGAYCGGTTKGRIEA
jgi:hypothetical protein